MIKGDIAMHITPNVSFEEASTLGGGIATVALAYYRYLELPLPPCLSKWKRVTESLFWSTVAAPQREH